MLAGDGDSLTVNASGPLVMSALTATDGAVSVGAAGPTVAGPVDAPSAVSTSSTVLLIARSNVPAVPGGNEFVTVTVGRMLSA